MLHGKKINCLNDKIRLQFIQLGSDYKLSLLKLVEMSCSRLGVRKKQQFKITVVFYFKKEKILK